MGGWLFLLAPVLLGALLWASVLFGTKEKRIRTVFGVAILGSIALAYLAFYMSLLCGLNDSGDSWEACQTGTNWWPLVGVPPLLSVPFLAIKWRGSWAWWVGFVIFSCAALVPWALLHSNR
jgi:hypothetical protein